MQFILSNYGHRVLQFRKSGGAFHPSLQLDERAVHFLDKLHSLAVLPAHEDSALQTLLARGLVQRVGDEWSVPLVRQRYERNPLEHLRRVVFEYTTVCNLECLHCRNSNLEATAEARPERLRAVVDAVLPLGISRFDFIGGEVMLYGRGWLEVVEYLRAQGGTHASVHTSGWFLGETNFLAAHQRYENDGAFLRSLKERGLTHVVFSLDGPEETHDRWRQVPGLYRRVLDGIEKVRDAGLFPRVSIVIAPGIARTELLRWVAELAAKIYQLPSNEEHEFLARQLLGDDSNYASNFIDVGGAVQLRTTKHALVQFSDEALRCKNFFRPSPTFRVKATGEVSLCPLIEGGDGYGNIHERSVIEVMNEMQNALLYQLHAEKRIAEYRLYLDEELFGTHITHVCTLRTALNMLAMGMHERAIDVEHPDPEALRALNLEVAEKMGMRPRTMKNRAIGHQRSEKS